MRDLNFISIVYSAKYTMMRVLGQYVFYTSCFECIYNDYFVILCNLRWFFK